MVVVVVVMEVEKKEYHYFLQISTVLDWNLMSEMDVHRLNQIKIDSNGVQLQFDDSLRDGCCC